MPEKLRAMLRWSAGALVPTDPVRPRKESEMLLNSHFADNLAAALRLCRTKEGFRLLAEAESEIGKLGASNPNAPRLLLLLAQWVDVGYRDHRLLEKLLERFPRNCRVKMPVEDYLEVIMAEAFHDLAAGQLDSAESRLDLVLQTFRDFPNTSHEALAHFWMG